MTDPDIADAEIEAVAKAIDPFGTLTALQVQRRARAAILASRAALLAEGKKMTAREPIDEQLCIIGVKLEWQRDWWRAMWDKAA